MTKQMNSTYDDLQVIIYISAIGGGLAMLWALYLIFLRSDATQGEYVQFWGVTLLVLFVVVILLAFLVHSMSTVYLTNRAKLPAIANCITSPQWKVVPQTIFKNSSMESEHNWAITWLTFGVMLLLAMLGVFVKTSGELAKLNMDQ